MNEHPRGLTMIETLLAIALLTVVVSAAVSWTATAGRLVATTAAPAREETAIEAVYRLIQTDLATGDFETARGRTSASRPSPPRVQLQDGALEIRTRAGRVCRYQLVRVGNVLKRTESDGTVRMLLHDVEALTIALDDEADTLDITIELIGEPIEPFEQSTALRVFTRRFNLP